MNGNVTTWRSVRPWLTAAVLAGVSTTVLAGCGGGASPGRPESSKTVTPGTPRGAGTSVRSGTTAPAGPNAGIRGGRQAPGKWSGGTPVTSGSGAGGTNRSSSGRTSSSMGAGSGGRAGVLSGIGGTASGLWNWGVGRPPGGLGAGLRSAEGGASRTGTGASRSPGATGATGTPQNTGTTSNANCAGAGASTGASPYADSKMRAMHDRMNGAHRGHMGVYTPPAGHLTGTPLSSPSSGLTALPAWSALKHYNGYLVSYRQITPWVANMGAHFGHRGPGIILMQNQDHQVVAADVGFPAAAGWHPWFDQPQGKPDGTIYSEHLYFTRPVGIVPSMPSNTPSDLASWSQFSAVNRAKTSSYKSIGPDPTVPKATQWGPPGPGVRVLLDSAQHVVGLVASWPSNSPAGWRPWFDQSQGSPIKDPVLGSVYTQHFWIVDPRSLA